MYKYIPIECNSRDIELQRGYKILKCLLILPIINPFSKVTTLSNLMFILLESFLCNIYTQLHIICFTRMDANFPIDFVQ